ncbi:DUF3131 domain-containing protein [Limimaricola pyoseonensis]|uniref:DUF3131 domain-containing protein n=1 Tax=Limimaricola pyoseonensis TaxID=521013 RepID=A0A1G7IHT6_9RHOB|nr:DUF3131 domain-containing protein [Limimaricola pyoseonensis]SDF12148.1 Protein of unknown function [Limimaricola pyoseonensis]
MIGRRDLLKGAGVVLAGFGPRPGWAIPAAMPSYTVLRDIAAGTSPEALRAVLSAFERHGLPVTCLVTLDAPEHGVLTADSPVAEVLADMTRTAPGLIEIAPHISELATLSSYFQARRAAEAVARLKGLLGGAENEARLTSIACDSPALAQSPQGLRGAGLRTVLLLAERSRTVRSERWPDGTVRFLGGERIDLGEARSLYWQIPAEQSQALWTLSMTDLDRQSPAQLAAEAAVFASQALAAELHRGLSHLTLSEAQLRDDFGYRRDFVLHLLTNSETSEAFLTLGKQLSAAGIPHGYSLKRDRGEGTVIAELEVDPSIAPARVGRVERLTEGRSRTSRTIELRAGPSGFRGLSEDNRLVLPATTLTRPEQVFELEHLAHDLEDTVLVVDTDGLEHEAHRTVLLRSLQKLGDRPGLHLASMPEAVARMLPQSPYIGHHRRTEHYSAAIRQPAGEIAPEERAALLEDARRAWRYFERWTHPATGLCPATAYDGPAGRRLHEAVTMWDVGSHINALIASHDLGLIGRAEFRARSGRILPQIVGRRFKGRLLPQGWIRTDRARWGTKDFDACDAGRLLAALYALENHPSAGARPMEIVRGYDLGDIIQAGEIQNVTDGLFHSSYRSHCAHYAAQAFRVWGFDARSPYEVLTGRSRADGQMALLEVSGLIGPLGAEPLLLEAIELGMSPESAYLADVLFGAQLEEYETTGRLKCVSECPIDRAPWFLYSGLQLDAEDRRWATDTVSGHARHRSQEFGAANAVISSKAAYLWAAWRPHPYSQALIDHVRANARQDVGFSPGIYEADDRAMPNYSDINTNAIILQSIAYRLTAANK